MFAFYPREGMYNAYGTTPHPRDCGTLWADHGTVMETRCVLRIFHYSALQNYQQLVELTHILKHICYSDLMHI